MGDTLLAFKAGRSFRREGTNSVDASPTKGAVYLENEEGLLHLKWKNRETNDFDEDLILFPQDASFSKVEQSNGRTYVLRFSSSNQRHFFWMQSADSSRDDEFANNVNSLLNDLTSELVWNQPASSSTAGPSNAGSSVRNDDVARLRELISAMSAGAPAEAQPEISLRDVLTPETLSPLFTSHPELISAIFPHLPPDLPSPSSPEALQRIIASPQFQAAVSSFDQALRTGLLGGLVRGLGLPEEAGTGVAAFLRAVQDQAGQSGSGGAGATQDSMETD